MGTREVTDKGATRGWETVMNEAAEGVLELSDADTLRASAAAGENVAATAAGVRQLLLGEVKTFRQQRLREALVEYQIEARKFRERSSQLPKQPTDRRQLLSSLFARYPQVGTTLLTIQHRDFKSLSDADIESLLKQLEALGVFRKE